MSASFIIDASITMAWFFADETTQASATILDRLEQDSALVPSHWFLEVANVLAMAERHRRTTAVRAADFLSRLALLQIEIDGEFQSRLSELLMLCRAHRLTSYDAAYLELAIRRRLPLATLDASLRAAAKSVGVELLGK